VWLRGRIGQAVQDGKEMSLFVDRKVCGGPNGGVDLVSEFAREMEERDWAGESGVRYWRWVYERVGSEIESCNHVTRVTYYPIVAGTARWASALTAELRASVHIDHNTATDSNTIVDHNLRSDTANAVSN
jgi:hypothetical protein